MNLDTLLRETIHDLAHEARPADLRQRVVAKGRRLRRRRAATVAVTAAATLAVAVAVPSLVWWSGRPAPVAAPPTFPTTQSDSPLTFDPAAHLPDGRIVGAVTGRTGPQFLNVSSTVWHRGQGLYVEVQYPMVIPAPVGDLAAVVEPDGRLYGLLNVATGDVQMLDVERMSVHDVPAWSPDGRYLAMLDFPRDGDLMLAIFDSVDRSVRRVPLQWPDVYCADFCALDWHDADTVTLPIGTNVSEAVSPRYSGVRLISTITGEIEDTIDLPGAYASSDDWSTDGRYVTLVNGGTSSQPVYFVYDTVEQREVVDSVNPLDAWWVAPTQWLQFRGNRLELVDTTGTVLGALSVPSVPESNHLVFIQA